MGRNGKPTKPVSQKKSRCMFLRYVSSMGTWVCTILRRRSIDEYDVGFGRKLRSCRASVEPVVGSISLLDSIWVVAYVYQVENMFNIRHIPMKCTSHPMGKINR